ncbi:hypothetical protein Tco_0488251 [Tanacetum coccineum]
MAALRYRDKHNKVCYLQKPTGSDAYHQILDFLRASHIRSPDLGPLVILATIERLPYTMTDGLSKNSLQLADDGGIDDLPITNLFGIENLRFLQTILGIETSNTRQYHMFKLSSKLFANIKLNFEGQPMPLLAAMLPQDQEGEGAGVAAQAVPPPIPEPIPEPMPEPDQPQDHLSTPLRQQTFDPIAPVFEHGQSLDPNIASFSRVHKTDDDPLSTFHHGKINERLFPSIPTKVHSAPPAIYTSGGARTLLS